MKWVEGMYSTSYLDGGILWLTGNPLKGSSDRPLTSRSGLSAVFPVNHSMPSSNYNREPVYLRPQRCMHTVASYPGLPSQLFFATMEPRFFPRGCEKSCEGRPGYEAMYTAVWDVLIYTTSNSYTYISRSHCRQKSW